MFMVRSRTNGKVWTGKEKLKNSKQKSDVLGGKPRALKVLVEHY